MSLELLPQTAFTARWLAGAPVLLAYLDPGSGSYLLQLLIAGLLGGMFVLKSQWGRIKSWFSRRSSQQEPESQDKKEE
jgi:hypothetical protein